MAMSPKDNALAAFYNESHDYVPLYWKEVAMGGTSVYFTQEMPQVDGTKDWFGVEWTSNYLGAIPKAGTCLLEDIADWEKVVKFPDIDSFDFKAAAAAEMSNPMLDRNNQVFTLWGALSMFTRLDALMGSVNALCALVEDPDSCKKFFEALSEHCIKYIHKAIDAFDPEVYFIIDDLATANSTFMSLDTYRDVIRPYEQRTIEAILEHDVIAGIHCCGKCESLIPDWLDMGITAWDNAQTMNDLAGILGEGKMALEGGWDSSGPCSAPDTTSELIEKEARRAMTEYKKPGFIFMPFIITERGNSFVAPDSRMDAAYKVWEEMRYF